MFEAFITAIFLHVTGLPEHDAQELTVCEETVQIYDAGLPHEELDQILIREGFVPAEDFARAGCYYTAEDGVLVDITLE